VTVKTQLANGIAIMRYEFLKIMALHRMFVGLLCMHV